MHDLSVQSNHRIATADTSLRIPRLLSGEGQIQASHIYGRNGGGRLSFITIVVLSILVTTLLVWAAATPIDEISVNSGEITTSDPIQQIQHFEGGIVASVAVNDGEHVVKGQLLMTLAPSLIMPELNQLRTRLTTAELRIKLLRSAQTAKTPSLEEVPERYAAIVNSQQRALQARRENMDSQALVLKRGLAEQEAELSKVHSEIEMIDSQVALIKQKVDAQRPLADKGHIPALQFLDDERDLSAMTGKRTMLDEEALRIRAAIAEAKARIDETRSRFKLEIANELGTLNTEAAELRLALRRAQDKVRRLTISAPVSGWVHDLKVHTVGGVISPGTTLLTIVPDEAHRHVEARISTRDIGHIHVGQKAKIKVLTYDYTRYGTITGRVDYISPSTFFDDDGNPYYKANISLGSDYVGDHPDMLIAPGMTVLVDIETGQKTLLAYLVEPITRSLSEALRER